MSDVTKKAIALAGGPSVVGTACQVTKQAVANWERAERIPARHCLTVEGLSGISRHVLRPDVFGQEPNDPNHRSESRAVA